MPEQPNPYRFTVSVGPNWSQRWPWSAWITDERGVQSHFYRGATEAEARSHAAQVLAALHTATMEETP